MAYFFRSFLSNLIKCFSRVNLIWHLLAIVITFILVMTGFDWFYFLATRNNTLQAWIFPAAIIGGLLPIFGIPALCLFGKIKKNRRIIDVACAIGQAALIGLLIAGFYKAFTGRIQPPLHGELVDISRGFRFGFLRGGVFWGWPSSHTTVAFAMAVSLISLYPKNKLAKYGALFYAFYIGLGVSTNIHWFSDFVAGAIIGSIIGVVVGKNFFKNKIDY